MEQFEPYIIQHGINDLEFFVGTPLAKDWYDPPRPYALLEYQWVLDNIPLKNKRIVDGGCHHGHYGLILLSQKANWVTLVDPHPSNLDIAEVNIALNGFQDWPWILKAAVLWKENGTVHYNGQSNGALVSTGIPVEAIRLMDIDPKAEVVKLDIEGAEYMVVPDALGSMKIESWIIEAHAGNQTETNAQDNLARQLKDSDYKLDWVNRESMKVEPYELGTIWPGHSTLFARR